MMVGDLPYLAGTAPPETLYSKRRENKEGPESGASRSCYFGFHIRRLQRGERVGLRGQGGSWPKKSKYCVDVIHGSPLNYLCHVTVLHDFWLFEGPAGTGPASTARWSLAACPARSASR